MLGAFELRRHAPRLGWWVPALLLGAGACGPAGTATDVPPGPESGDAEERPMGLVLKDDDVAPGFVLYSPLTSGRTFLVNTDGRVVHGWDSDYAPHSLYLLDDGRLLRPGRDPDAVGFQAGGAMGLLEIYSWEGERLWHWKISDDTRILHHDVEPLPNGNLLALGWELITPEEARAAGRREDLLPEDGLWSDFVVEIEPVPPDDARIVWKWRVWDHLIQNVDKSLPNYADPATNPHRLDINAGGPPMEIDADQLAQLQAIGYVPTPDGDEATEDKPASDDKKEEEELRSDFLHVNAIDWNPTLDQLAMTVPELGEVWIIKRPRSTAEAAGPEGDLLYRWGNPSTYGKGSSNEKRLFYPHDVQWIPAGYEDGGQLTIFNNGSGRPEGEWSSIEQIAPPLVADGTYALLDGAPWGPAKVSWHYRAPEPQSFYAAFISGAHRLPNGHTFVTSGPQGRLFEVDREGRTVWEFWNHWGGGVRRPNTHGKNNPGQQQRFAYAIWRAQKYPPDHPALANRRLEPISPQPKVFIPPPPREEDRAGRGD